MLEKEKEKCHFLLLKLPNVKEVCRKHEEMKIRPKTQNYHDTQQKYLSDTRELGLSDKNTKETQRRMRVKADNRE